MFRINLKIYMKVALPFSRYLDSRQVQCNAFTQSTAILYVMTGYKTAAHKRKMTYPAFVVISLVMVFILVQCENFTHYIF